MVTHLQHKTTSLVIVNHADESLCTNIFPFLICSRYLSEMSRYTGPMHVPNKRIKKPIGAPKRAMSSFLSYSQLMRPEIRLQYPHLKNTDVSSVLAQKWHEASKEEKKPHIERELRDREKYHEDMAQWRQDEQERLESNRASTEFANGHFEEIGQRCLHSSIPKETFPSIWAAMIDVDEPGGTGAGTYPPLYDDAMDGFWDIDVEDNNEEGTSDGSAPTTISASADGVNSDSSRFLSENTTNQAIVKNRRLAKRAHERRNIDMEKSSQLNAQLQECVIPLTGRQLEVQQKRQQQQHQYQMYQQHILNQKHKGDKGRDDLSMSGTIVAQMTQERVFERESSIRSLSAGAIVKGGRLHSQSMVNERTSSREAQQTHMLPAYQGLQSTHMTRSSERPDSPYCPSSNSFAAATQLPLIVGDERYSHEPPQSYSSQSSKSPTLSQGVPLPQPQSMRHFQFEEQDQMSVMQTLMAVHRATASRAGDSETVRSLDRMQMGQYSQGHGLYSDRSITCRPMQAPSQLIQPSSNREGRMYTSTSSDLLYGSMAPAECAPLSLVQQERQNQTERMQLSNRQQKQLQDMLALQQREQAEQSHQHSSSIVSASSASSSLSFSNSVYGRDRNA